MNRIIISFIIALFITSCSDFKSKNNSTEEIDALRTELDNLKNSNAESQNNTNGQIATFFKKAELHPNAHLIKGVICGYRIENIAFDLYRQVRYLDKLVDELAKGRKMEKILRKD